MGQNQGKDFLQGDRSAFGNNTLPLAESKRLGTDISGMQVSSSDPSKFLSRLSKKRGKSPWKNLINSAWIAEIQASDRSEILHKIKPTRERSDKQYYKNINNVNQTITFVEEFYFRRAEVKSVFHITGGPLLSLDVDSLEDCHVEETLQEMKEYNLMHKVAVETFDDNQKKIRLNELANNPRFRGDMKQGRKEYTKLFYQRKDYKNETINSFSKNESSRLAGLTYRNYDKQKAQFSTGVMLNGSQTGIEQNEVQNILSSPSDDENENIDKPNEQSFAQKLSENSEEQDVVEEIENDKTPNESVSEEPSIAPDNVDEIFGDFEADEGDLNEDVEMNKKENSQQVNSNEEDKTEEQQTVITKNESLISLKTPKLSDVLDDYKNSFENHHSKDTDSKVEESNQESRKSSQSEKVEIYQDLEQRKSRVYGFHGGHMQPKLESQESKKFGKSFSDFDYNSVQDKKSSSQSSLTNNNFPQYYSKKSTLSNTNLSNLEKREEEEKQKEIHRNRKEAQHYYKTLPRGVYGGSKKYSGEILSQSKESSEKKSSKKDIEPIESSINISGYLMNDSQDLQKKEKTTNRPSQNMYEEQFSIENKKEGDKAYPDFRSLLTNFEYETDTKSKTAAAQSSKGYGNFISDLGGRVKNENLDERDLNFDNDFLQLDRSKSQSHKLSEVESFTGMSKLRVTSKKLTMRSDVDFPDFV